MRAHAMAERLAGAPCFTGNRLRRGAPSASVALTGTATAGAAA